MLYERDRLLLLLLLVLVLVLLLILLVLVLLILILLLLLVLLLVRNGDLAAHAALLRVNAATTATAADRMKTWLCAISGMDRSSGRF